MKICHFITILFRIWAKGTNILGNRGTPDYSQKNGFMVGIENYIFL